MYDLTPKHQVYVAWLSPIQETYKLDGRMCVMPQILGIIFFSNTPQIRYKTTFLLQGHMKPGETLPELHLLYKMSLLTTLFFLHKQKLGFLPKIYRI